VIKNGYNDPSKYKCWKLYWATLKKEKKKQRTLQKRAENTNPEETNTQNVLQSI